MEYYQQVVNESIEVQQKAAKSTRAFAVVLAKAKNNMVRRESLFNKDYLKGGAPTQPDGPLLKGEPPHFNIHEKKVLTVGCPRCQLFGCAKAWHGDDECDIFGKPTKKRVERIVKNEKYKAKVDTYRKEKKQEALDYETEPSSNVHEFPSDLLSNEDYAAFGALVESLLDDEGDVEAEFSMCKCAMMKNGTYFSETEEDRKKEKELLMQKQHESNQ